MKEFLRIQDTKRNRCRYKEARRYQIVANNRELKYFSMLYKDTDLSRNVDMIKSAEIGPILESILLNLFKNTTVRKDIGVSGLARLLIIFSVSPACKSEHN